jgi:hypothetical protein
MMKMVNVLHLPAAGTPKTYFRKAKLFKRKKLDRRVLRLDDLFFDAGLSFVDVSGDSSTAKVTSATIDCGSSFSSDMMGNKILKLYIFQKLLQTIISVL